MDAYQDALHARIQELDREIGGDADFMAMGYGDNLARMVYDLEQELYSLDEPVYAEERP